MSDLLIRNLNRFVTLTSEENDTVLSLFRPRNFRRHQFIQQEGEVARYETFLLSGLTRTYEIDEKGAEHIVLFGTEDWWVGDLYSFLTGLPSTYAIDCLEDTQTMQVSKDDLEELYVRVPKLERHFRIMIQKAYITSTRRITSSLRKSAAERYMDFIRTYPSLEQRIPNHQIASFLGITPQSLSRIRAKGNTRKTGK